ncbi:hypothetical protein TRAPUB_1052 [Trametes pubescens]|uniref:Uncharacterized protein n=1 Tax=Trametes pubescens TaxID=154538 RepID=A0A1M2VKJ4_TRAPU|nr:hypothetical protein TRAPUB_1052 [Trametes pubescens]
MVDRSIQAGSLGGNVDVWDHTSHMREYLTDSEMVRNTVGMPNKFWQWILDHMPQILLADALLEEVASVEATRFYCMSVNAMNNTADALRTDSDNWATLSEPWIAALGEDGWKDSYTREVVEIGTILTTHVPKSDKQPATIGKKAIVRTPRYVTRSLGAGSLDKHECMRFLTINVLEWRAVDPKNRDRNLYGIAFHIFVAHKMYEKTLKHMLATDVGRTLREDFLHFLDEQWNCVLPVDPIPQADPEQPVAGLSYVEAPAPPPLAPIPLICSAPRRQWDQVIVDRLLKNAPPPVRTREERIALREIAARRARWEEYTNNLAHIVNTVLKSPLAQYLPSEKDTIEGNIGDVLEQLVTALINNANRREFRRTHPTEPYLQPMKTLHLIHYPPIPRAHDSHFHASLAEFRAHDPEAYEDFLAKRKRLHDALTRLHAEDPQQPVSVLEDLLPQDVALAPPELIADTPVDDPDGTKKAQAEDQELDDFLNDDIEDAMPTLPLVGAVEKMDVDDSEFEYKGKGAVKVPAQTRVTRSTAPRQGKDDNMDVTQATDAEGEPASEPQDPTRLNPSHAAHDASDTAHDASDAAPDASDAAHDASDTAPDASDKNEASSDDDSDEHDQTGRCDLFAGYPEEPIQRTPHVRLLAAAAEFLHSETVMIEDIDLKNPPEDHAATIWEHIDKMSDEELFDTLDDKIIRVLGPKECALAIMTYRPLFENPDHVAVGLPPIGLPPDYDVVAYGEECLSKIKQKQCDPAEAQRVAGAYLYELILKLSRPSSRPVDLPADDPMDVEVASSPPSSPRLGSPTVRSSRDAVPRPPSSHVASSPVPSLRAPSQPAASPRAGSSPPASLHVASVSSSLTSLSPAGDTQPLTPPSEGTAREEVPAPVPLPPVLRSKVAPDYPGGRLLRTYTVYLTAGAVGFLRSFPEINDNTSLLEHGLDPRVAWNGVSTHDDDVLMERISDTATASLRPIHRALALLTYPVNRTGTPVTALPPVGLNDSLHAEYVAELKRRLEVVRLRDGTIEQDAEFLIAAELLLSAMNDPHVLTKIWVPDKQAQGAPDQGTQPDDVEQPSSSIPGPMSTPTPAPRTSTRNRGGTSKRMIEDAPENPPVTKRARSASATGVIGGRSTPAASTSKRAASTRSANRTKALANASKAVSVSDPIAEHEDEEAMQEFS